MLRTRAFKERGSPFVCAVCRHKLSRAGQLRSRNNSTLSRPAVLSRCSQRVAPSNASIWGARSLSTTVALFNSNNNGGPPRPGGFPGAFPGLGGGAIGSFAGGANRPTNGDSKPSDGLLPHEREARQKAGPKASAPSPPPAAKPSQPPSRFDSQAGQQQSNGRGGSQQQAQASISSSVLADVFNADRKPRAPPTPQAWSQGDQQQVKPATATGQAAFNNADSRKRGAGTGLFLKSAEAGKGRSLPGWGDFGGDKDPFALPDRKPASRTGSAAEKPKWGAFSSRKSTIAEPPAERPRRRTTERSTTSSPWDQIKRERQTDKAGAGNKRTSAADNDFWNELETRVKPQGGQRRTTDSSNNAFSSPSKAGVQQSMSASMDSFTPRQDTASAKPRRSSRFDTDHGDDKRPTKSNQRQRVRSDPRGFTEDYWDEESSYRWELKQQQKRERKSQKKQEAEPEQVSVPIYLPEYINVTNLAQAIKQPSKTFLADLEEMGFENMTDDTILTGETAALIVMEYGYDPTVDTGSSRDLRPRPTPEDVTSLPSRPPVVTIMGHVDHGKTTLLDWLRKSSVAAQEHGGITQHIGAFIVKMSSGSPITFLDTPGHAAFLSMRQRGANVTDIIVLVVAADDSVMPQTLEALKHATAAKVPIIVAISKIDKEDARVDQVKADLSRHGVQIEDYGGDVQVVGVSGKTGQGMQDLEENIVTLSEILDVRSERDGLSEGWILESSVKPDGRAATVLVKRGTLRPGDLVVAGKTWARIRVLRNEAGVDLDEAPPGTPVEILGWRDLPTAGEQVLQAPDEGAARTAVEYRQEMSDREESSVQLAQQEQRQREKAAAEEEAAKKDAADEQDTPVEPGIKYQNFTVKADVAGSVEAVCASILELGNHEVRPKVLRSSAGQVSESDVDHAAASGAVIVNFNSPIQPHIKHRAEEAKVRILDHSVIYHVIDNVKSTLEELLPNLEIPRVLGEADILQTFDINIRKKVFRKIAGCRVRNGTIKRSSLVKVLRRGKVVFDGKIETLKQVKKDVDEMGKGSECGIGLDGFEDIKIDDQIQTYEITYEKRHL